MFAGENSSEHFASWRHGKRDFSFLACSFVTFQIHGEQYWRLLCNIQATSVRLLGNYCRLLCIFPVVADRLPGIYNTFARDGLQSLANTSKAAADYWKNTQ